MTKTIGFIGVGLMGHGVAKNILEGGFPVTVLAHRNREPVDDLLSRGAKEATSAADLAGSVDILFTCVSNSAVMEKVVRAENGILEGVRDRTTGGLIVVDMTTAEPSSTLALGADLADAGVTLVDGPVTLTPKEAEEGRLNIMIGAEAAVLEEIRPVLETFSEHLFHTGPLGSAHTLKLINNFLTLGNAALVVEACTAAGKAGVDPKVMVDLISVGGGNSTSFQRMARLLTGDGDPAKAAFAIENALKDVSYFWRLADQQDAYAPLADAVRRWYDLAVALGHGKDLLPTLFELHEKLSGKPITPT